MESLTKRGENPILVADSYYLDQASLISLWESEITYLCGVQECWFADLTKKAAELCKKPGKTAILCNDTTGETLCHHWYQDKRIGRKFVLANCLTRGD